MHYTLCRFKLSEKEHFGDFLKHHQKTGWAYVQISQKPLEIGRISEHNQHNEIKENGILLQKLFWPL